jgi:hypothetical protein
LQPDADSGPTLHHFFTPVMSSNQSSLHHPHLHRLLS